MKPLVVVLCGSLLAGTAFAQGADGLLPELEKIEEGTRTAPEIRKKTEKFEGELERRGFATEQLLRAQDRIIARRPGERWGRPGDATIFWGIGRYLHLKWSGTESSGVGAVKHYLGIAGDKQYSEELRSHYLGTARDAIRNYRGSKDKTFQAARDSLVQAALKIEEDDKEPPKLRAMSLDIYGSTELDDRKRRAKILKHCRSEVPELRHTAVDLTGFRNNYDDAISEELLRDYEKAAADAADKRTRQALRRSLWRITYMSEKHGTPAIREKIEKRLESLQKSTGDKKSRAEVEQLLKDIRSKEDMPGGGKKR